MRSLYPVVALVVAIPWSSAVANEPRIVNPANCEAPGRIIVVGSNGVSADAVGTFSVVVRDFFAFPMQGCPVDASFAGCPGMRICPNQLDPGVTVNCASRQLSKLSNSAGVAGFKIIGAASPSACPSDPLGCVSIYACGVLLGTATVAALDLDGAPGLTGNDLAEWLGGFFCNSSSPRLDYDGDGVVGGSDLSAWLAAFQAGGSASGCSVALCP